MGQGRSLMFGSLILPGAGEVYGSVRWISFGILPIAAALAAVYFQYRRLDPGDGLTPITVIRRLALCAVLLLAYPYLIRMLVTISSGISGSIFGASDADAFMAKIVIKIVDRMGDASQRGSGIWDALELSFDTKWSMAALGITRVTHTIAEFNMKMIFSVLYVVGPLAIAFGVVPGSPTLGSWTKSIAQVATWNIIFAILYRLSVSSGMQADLTSDNFVTNLASSIGFAVAILSTPAITMLIFRGGAGAVGSIANVLAVSAGMSVAKTAAGTAAAAATGGAVAAPGLLGKIISAASASKDKSDERPGD